MNLEGNLRIKKFDTDSSMGIEYYINEWFKDNHVDVKKIEFVTSSRHSTIAVVTYIQSKPQQL